MNFKYPYTNFHELNLDWLITEINRIKQQIKDLPDLDEKIKELEEMLADLEATLARTLGLGIVDNSNFNLYAQILPDANSRFNGRMFAQGFCIGDHAGVPYATQTFIELDNNDDVISQIITMTDMTTGNRMITNVHTELEHANSITYVPPLDRYVIATAGAAGDTGKIVEIDKSGNTYQIHYLDAPMFAVAYNNDVIYTLGGHTLYKYDTDFNLIESVELDLQQLQFTYQGLAADDHFLYIFNGNTIPANTAEYNINRVSVFSHEGLPVKQVIMRYPLEIEEGDFLDGEFYISSNTTHAALLLKVDMYTRNRIHSFGEPLDNIDLNQNGIEIHVDESYNGFLVDGSNDHPLSAITWLILWLRNSTDRMNIKIDSDITQVTTLSFRRCPNTIFDINGQNHKLPNLLFDGGTLYLNNAVLPGIDHTNSITFHGKRLVLNNITFGESGSVITPERLIFTTSSFEINGMIVNQSVLTSNNDTGYLMYALGDGYFRSVTFNTIGTKYRLIAGLCAVSTSFAYDRITIGTENMKSQPIYLSDYQKTYSLLDMRYTAIVAHSGGTITDLPASVILSDIRFIEILPYINNVNSTNTCAVFHLSNGTTLSHYYKANV